MTCEMTKNEFDKIIAAKGPRFLAIVGDLRYIGEYGFKAIVIDTSKPDIDRAYSDDYVEYSFAEVCACYSMTDAKMVAKAMNADQAQDLLKGSDDN